MPAKVKVATAEDGQLLPMPDEANEVSDIKVNYNLPAEAMDIIRKRHIPYAMEDHWFMYCEEVAVALFVYLIAAETGGDAAGAWENFLRTWDRFTVIKKSLFDIEKSLF